MAYLSEIMQIPTSRMFSVGQEDVSIAVSAVDAITGMPKTGLTAANVKASFYVPLLAPIVVDLQVLNAIDSGYKPGGWFEIDSVKAPGEYRFDIPNAVFSQECAVVKLMFGGVADVLFQRFDFSVTPATIGDIASGLTEMIRVLMRLIEMNRIPSMMLLSAKRIQRNITLQKRRV